MNAVQLLLTHRLTRALPQNLPPASCNTIRVLPISTIFVGVPTPSRQALCGAAIPNAFQGYQVQPSVIALNKFGDVHLMFTDLALQGGDRAGMK